MDKLKLGDYEFGSRFILGSGKSSVYSKELIDAAVSDAGAELISVVVGALEEDDSVLRMIPSGVTILPNTLGAKNADDAVAIAHTSREMGFGDMIKIEIMHDSKYLLPDNAETIKATEILAKEGFTVMPYMYPELSTARDLYNAGAMALMPLASPSGSSKGLATRDFIKILIEEIDLPIIVDAGIGKPSQACEAMEMGADAVMINTALATATNIPVIASAFKKAVEAGHLAYLSHGRI